MWQYKILLKLFQKTSKRGKIILEAQNKIKFKFNKKTKPVLTDLLNIVSNQLFQHHKLFSSP